MLLLLESLKIPTAKHIKPLFELQKKSETKSSCSLFWETKKPKKGSNYPFLSNFHRIDAEWDTVVIIRGFEETPVVLKGNDFADLKNNILGNMFPLFVIYFTIDSHNIGKH
jgi:hypothetical protein